MGGQCHGPATLSPGKGLGNFCIGAVWAPGPVWIEGGKSLSHRNHPAVTSHYTDWAILDYWVEQSWYLMYNQFMMHGQKNIKVKGSLNRPGVAQRVLGGLGSQISWHSANEGGDVVSFTHQPSLPPGNIPGTHFHQGLSRPQGYDTDTAIVQWIFVRTKCRISRANVTSHFFPLRGPKFVDRDRNKDI